MKKLIMFMAVAAMAFASQAATYIWKTSANMQGVNAAGVVDNGNYAAETTNMKNNGTWNVILALYDTTTGALVGQSASTAVKFSATGSKANTGSIVIDDAVAGTTYDYVLTVTGTQNALTSRGVDGSYDYSGATLSTTISGQIATASMGNTQLDSNVPSTWTITGITEVGGGGSGGSDVPEPTSGLLLALGGAMLALRRRRA